MDFTEDDRLMEVEAKSESRRCGAWPRPPLRSLGTDSTSRPWWITGQPRNSPGGGRLVVRDGHHGDSPHRPVDRAQRGVEGAVGGGHHWVPARGRRHRGPVRVWSWTTSRSRMAA